MVNDIVDEKNIEDLCRICANPGSHSIFRTIPPYLHEHIRDFPNWKQPIFKLISDITGLQITCEDGLPQKICVLCISYLKHAYVFRQQAIDTVASLVTAKYLSCDNQDKDKKSDLFSNLNIIPTTPVRQNLINTNSAMSTRSKTDKKATLNKIISDTSSCSSDEQILKVKIENMEAAEGPSFMHQYFNYTEKEFEEDDVTMLDVFKHNNIIFNLPKNYKERKCPSCRKRFMFDDSLNDHLKQCMQYKLVRFVREVYHLLFLKENRSISSYDFIRRIVFSIRKSNKILDSYDGDLVLEGADQHGKQEPNSFVLDKSFITNFNILQANYDTEDKQSVTTSSESISPVIMMSKCNKCPVKFETLTELESHNFTHHYSMNNQIAATLSTPTSNLDVIKNNLLLSDDIDPYKTVKCSKCDLKFYTISHLDEHTNKMHKALSSPTTAAMQYQNNFLKSNYFYNMENIKHKK